MICIPIKPLCIIPTVNYDLLKLLILYIVLKHVVWFIDSVPCIWSVVTHNTMYFSRAFQPALLINLTERYAMYVYMYMGTFRSASITTNITNVDTRCVYFTTLRPVVRFYELWIITFIYKLSLCTYTSIIHVTMQTLFNFI